MEKADPTKKSNNISRNNIKFCSLFSLTKKTHTDKITRGKDSKQNCLCFCGSSTQLSMIKTPQLKYSVFGTIKRNIQNKFLPNRKIVVEDPLFLNTVQNVYVDSNNINNRDLSKNSSGYSNEFLNVPESHEEQLEQNNEHIYSSLINTSNQIMADNDNSAVHIAKKELAKYGWYWGALSRTAAQRTLAGKPNGSFLVRDSETDKHQFTLSFRSASVTLHNRINYVDGYWQIESLQYKSIVDLFEDTIKKSEEGVFCFVKSVNRLLPPVAVRLTNPINRCFEVASLQHLCRYTIRNKLDVKTISEIILPSKVKEFIEEGNSNL